MRLKNWVIGMKGIGVCCLMVDKMGGFDVCFGDGLLNGFYVGVVEVSMFGRLAFFCISYLRCASKLMSFSCNSSNVIGL